MRLTEDQCWRFLARHSLGRVAFAYLGAPMVLPVNYALDGQTVVFRTGHGSSLAEAATGQPVVFEVDDVQEPLDTGTSVLVHGTLHQMSRAEVAALRTTTVCTWPRTARGQFLRIAPEWVSGRTVPTQAFGDGLVADGG